MNSVQILGNLARDPEVRYTKTGRAVEMCIRDRVRLVALKMHWAMMTNKIK